VKLKTPIHAAQIKRKTWK